jgi:hypothetical protein
MRKTIISLASLALAAGAFGGTAYAGGWGQAQGGNGGCNGAFAGGGGDSSGLLTLDVAGHLLQNVNLLNACNAPGGNVSG